VLTAAGRRRAGLEATNTIVPSAEATVDWSPYTDTSLYNPALLPGDVQAMVKGGGERIFKDVNDTDFPDDDAINTMDMLGLDPKSRADCQIYADLMSEFDPAKGVVASRDMSIDRTSFVVYNGSFSTRSTLTPDGVGYAMIARQLAAAKEIARRTGMSGEIKVNATNSSAGTYTGASVWPKLGYEFQWDDVPTAVLERIRKQGFQVTPYDTVSDFMIAQNANGQYGFDVWREATEGIVFSMDGRTVIEPNASETLAERVTREYGKRKGFVKSKAFEAMFDDAVLRDVWMSFTQKGGAE